MCTVVVYRSNLNCCFNRHSWSNHLLMQLLQEEMTKMKGAWSTVSLMN
jgi:hypothetical protein